MYLKVIHLITPLISGSSSPNNDYLYKTGLKLIAQIHFCEKILIVDNVTYQTIYAD